jgi:hypothetical protein
MKIILSDLVKIKQIHDIEPSDLDFFISKNNNYQILTPRFDLELELESPIPLDLDSKFVLVNPMVHQANINSLSTNITYAEETLRESFFTNINQKRINKAKMLLKELSKDKDVYYRIMHHSYKMYWLKEYSIQLLNEIISLCDQKEFKAQNNYELIEKLLSMGFSQILLNIVISILNTNFTSRRNKVDLWANDAIVLAGTFSILKEYLLFIIQFSQDLLNNVNILQTDRNTLLPHEAGFMDIWLPIRPLRNGNKEIVTKCITLISNQKKIKR